MYNETIVTDWYVDVDDDDGLCQPVNLLVEFVIISMPPILFPTRIIITLSFKAVKYLLVVLMNDIYMYIWVKFVCDTISI